MHLSVNLLPTLLFRGKHALAAPLPTLVGIATSALRSSAWLAVLCSTGWSAAL